MSLIDKIVELYIHRTLRGDMSISRQCRPITDTHTLVPLSSPSAQNRKSQLSPNN